MAFVFAPLLGLLVSRGMRIISVRMLHSNRPVLSMDDDFGSIFFNMAASPVNRVRLLFKGF